MTLLFSFLVIILFDLIILTMLKGTVLACITKRIYLGDQLMQHFFLSVCYVKCVTLRSQKGYVIVIYRSPSQSTVEFDEFLSNFENLFNFVKGLKPSFTIILDDFKARCKSWWPDDITSSEVTDINLLTTMHGLHQLISHPTHILPNSLSCIDLY